MVKNILSIIISSLLIAAVSAYEIFYIDKNFSLFGEEAKTLYDKTEEKIATAEDAEALKMSWDKIKSHMYVWVPHEDISSIDYWLDEAAGLIYVGDYDAALPKISVLLDICADIPSSYSPNTENIF